MRVYFDNCCLNRPFDDQRQIRVRLEAEAKLCIQEHIRSGALELVWSYMLDFENAANPFDPPVNRGNCPHGDNGEGLALACP